MPSQRGHVVSDRDSKLRPRHGIAGLECGSVRGVDIVSLVRRIDAESTVYLEKLEVWRRTEVDRFDVTALRGVSSGPTQARVQQIKGAGRNRDTHIHVIMFGFGLTRPAASVHEARTVNDARFVDSDDTVAFGRELAHVNGKRLRIDADLQAVSLPLSLAESTRPTARDRVERFIPFGGILDDGLVVDSGCAGIGSGTDVVAGTGEVTGIVEITGERDQGREPVRDLDIVLRSGTGFRTDAITGIEEVTGTVEGTGVRGHSRDQGQGRGHR